MTNCEWPGCAATATHTVDIAFPERPPETWQVCRAHDRTLKVQATCSRPKAPPPPEPPPPTINVQCGLCHQVLNEPASLPVDERQPCPTCGSLTRAPSVAVADGVTLRESVRVRSKRPGKGGWMTDIKTGDDYTRCLDGWGTRTLERNRETNAYREVIMLYDGTRLESRGQLSEHHD